MADVSTTAPSGRYAYRRRRYRIHARTLAEDCWGCPVCDAPPGWECPGDTPHEARVKRAQMLWWGCTEEEIPARAARAKELREAFLRAATQDAN